MIGDFVCSNKICISHNLTCDSNNDCGDWSDEKHCKGWYLYTHTHIVSCSFILIYVFNKNVQFIGVYSLSRLLHVRKTPVLMQKQEMHTRSMEVQRRK